MKNIVGTRNFLGPLFTPLEACPKLNKIFERLFNAYLLKLPIQKERVKQFKELKSRSSYPLSSQPPLHQSRVLTIALRPPPSQHRYLPLNTPPAPTP
ncbi:Uncharacterized protein FKW44_016044, partial [Caligus rogercresseyi]